MAARPMRFGERNPGETVHIRAQALTDTHTHLYYRAAMAVVLRDDPALKAAYAVDVSYE
jgi:ABC-type tungstate transport system permease subunit